MKPGRLERWEYWLRRHWPAWVSVTLALLLALAWWAMHLDEVAALARHWLNIIRYLFQP